MSYILFNNGSVPAVPAAGKTHLFVDSSDRYLKLLDEKGILAQVGDHDINNLIRNSGFWFAQRQNPGNATTYSTATGRAIGADGWGLTCENASSTYRRIDTASSVESGLQGQYYGEFLKTTSTGKLIVTQAIEGKDTTGIRGRTVRLQAWVKASTGTPVINMALVQLTNAGTIDSLPATFFSALGANGTDPTLGSNLSYIAPKSGVTPDNGTVNGNRIELTASTIWQRFGSVFDVPTNCKNLIVMIYGNAQFAAAAGFNLAQVSLTDGYEIQDWTPMNFPSERNRVLRFYQKTFAMDTAPAQNAGVTTGCLRCILGKAAATALAAQFQWRYEIPLRAAATTLTTYNPGAANAQVRQIGGTAADLTATATANSTEQSVDITATGAAGGAVGDQCGVHVSADSEL